MDRNPLEMFFQALAPPTVGRRRRGSTAALHHGPKRDKGKAKSARAARRRNR